MKKIFIYFVALLGFANYSYAFSTFTSTISHVYPHSDDSSEGNFIILFSSDVGTACTNASNPKYYYFRNGVAGVNKESRDKMYSAILTAAAAKKNVTVWFDESSPNCDVNRLWVAF